MQPVLGCEGEAQVGGFRDAELPDLAPIERQPWTLRVVSTYLCEGEGEFDVEQTMGASFAGELS